MTYKSLGTVIREIVTCQAVASITEETIEETHGAEEVKILSNPESEQTPADIVAAKYVRKCSTRKAELQKKVIDNA